MDITVIASQGQYYFLILAFYSFLGFLNGYLIRELSIIKIIVLIFLTPLSIKLLVDLDRVVLATIPFLLFAWFGYYGFRKSYYKLREVYEVFR